MAKIYATKEGLVNYSSGNQSRLELSRNYHVQAYNCKLKVNHTNASASFKAEHLLNLINGIQIVANGDETIKSVPANKFHIGAILASGNKGLQDIKTTDGTKDSYVWFTIYFAIPNTYRPADTIFNTAVYSTLDMLVNWGASSNVGTGVTVNSAQLEVFSHSLTNYTRDVNEKIKHYKETYLKKVVDSTSNQFQIDLPVKQLYKSFAIVSTLDGVRTNEIINKITLKSGTSVIMQLDAEAIRSFNYLAYNVKAEDDLKGIHILDFISRGKLSDILDTMSKFNSLELVLDVTQQSGLNELHIYSDIIDIKNTVEVSA